MAMTPAERSKRYKDKDPDGYRARKREYIKTTEEREKRREYQRKWREANREHHNESARISHQKHKHKHIEKRREYHLVKKYGITQAEYEQMVSAQGGACAICKTTEFTGVGKRLHVDHDHQTCKVRGLLCYSCNTRLGWFEENAVAITSYMMQHELEKVS